MWTSDENGLLRRKKVLETGVTAREFDAAVAGGALLAVGRGVYIDAAGLTGKADYLQRELTYRARCLAAVRSDGDDPPIRVLSHQSAASIHRLEVLDTERTRVHFTNGKAAGGRLKGRRIVIHTGKLNDDDVTVLHGVSVTGLERTAVDIALTARSFAPALAVFDSALRHGADPDRLRQQLEVARTGVARARVALRYASGLAANPGESWCRAQIIAAGFPVPVLQKRYRLNDGTAAEVDHDFEGQVVLEFDGESKYGAQWLRPGQTPADVVVAEKRREDGLRELGLEVVRAMWDDLRSGTMIPRLGVRLRSRGIHVPGDF
ncbi:hypothetical protein [Gordonia hirsuta]|nr:hypothetical protein [Gordonia hirsuta]